MAIPLAVATDDLRQEVVGDLLAVEPYLPVPIAAHHDLLGREPHFHRSTSPPSWAINRQSSSQVIQTNDNHQTPGDERPGDDARPCPCAQVVLSFVFR